MNPTLSLLALCFFFAACSNSKSQQNESDEKPSSAVPLPPALDSAYVQAAHNRLVALTCAGDARCAPDSAVLQFLSLGDGALGALRGAANFRRLKFVMGWSVRDSLQVFVQVKKRKGANKPEYIYYDLADLRKMKGTRTADENFCPPPGNCGFVLED